MRTADITSPRQPRPTAIAGSAFALLYDADCGFCRGILACILRWDRQRRLRPIPLQSPEAALLAPMAPELRARSWHLVSPSGKCWSAGHAIAPLMRLLPRGRPIAVLAVLFPGATNAAYWFVARHRAGLGRLTGSTCGMPR
ncbi:MAG TPA: DCC1-like thiol-disulfide oxidoreductase family protein [Tepidiformaceae bacterium]